MKYRFLGIAIMAMAVTSGWAQADPASEAQLDRLTMPAHLNSSASRVQFAAEEPVNLIQGSVAFSASCDDNILSQTTNKLGDCAYSFVPSIALHRATPLTQTHLSYSPGFTLHQKLDNYNESTHHVGIDFTARATPHLTIRLRDSFARTTNLFDASQDTTPIFGPVQQTNGSVITPIAQFMTNTAGLDVGYQFTRRSNMGASVTYSDLRYDNVGNTSMGLIDSKSGTAAMFYNYRISRKQSMGVSYVFHKLWFGEGTNAVAHSILYTHSIAISPSVAIGFFAGPDYTISEGQVLFDGTVIRTTGRTESWQPTAGVNLTVQKNRTAVVAGYTKRIADGGGVLGATSLHEAHASLSRRLGKRWTADAGFQYGHSNLLNATIDTPVDTVSVGGGVQHQLARNVSLDVRYGWSHQDGGSGGLGFLSVDHNRVAVALTYSFSKPLGR